MQCSICASWMAVGLTSDQNFLGTWWYSLFMDPCLSTLGLNEWIRSAFLQYCWDYLVRRTSRKWNWKLKCALQTRGMRQGECENNPGDHLDRSDPKGSSLWDQQGCELRVPWLAPKVFVVVCTLLDSNINTHGQKDHYRSTYIRGAHASCTCTDRSVGLSSAAAGSLSTWSLAHSSLLLLSLLWLKSPLPVP